MLRIAAALALLLGITGFLGYLRLIGEGPFVPLPLRHLRELKERTEPPRDPQPLSFAQLRALPHDWSVAEYSALERRGVTLEGYVQRVLRASDDDIHLEVTPEWPAPERGLVSYATAEITPGVRRDAPAWNYGTLVRAFRVNEGDVTPWDAGPRRVRLTGWLLFDFQYDSRPDSLALASGARRMSGWEVHPVTGIELWDDSLARYLELPR
jgi:hypothetical protein